MMYKEISLCVILWDPILFTGEYKMMYKELSSCIILCCNKGFPPLYLLWGRPMFRTCALRRFFPSNLPPAVDLRYCVDGLAWTVTVVSFDPINLAKIQSGFGFKIWLLWAITNYREAHGFPSAMFQTPVWASMLVLVICMLLCWPYVKPCAVGNCSCNLVWRLHTFVLYYLCLFECLFDHCLVV